ncbi:hypothetical protein [Rhizobium sp. Leaf262]|uniref:hypothetical protein n=1 Tax=Rhizobium sp. Leaf262 TaxID=1736312 RepID=UPI001AEC2EF8|nr:hypothetical protein [Rhizobium sp. Leaf262]
MDVEATFGRNVEPSVGCSLLSQRGAFIRSISGFPPLNMGRTFILQTELSSFQLKVPVTDQHRTRVRKHGVASHTTPIRQFKKCQTVLLSTLPSSGRGRAIEQTRVLPLASANNATETVE